MKRLNFIRNCLLATILAVSAFSCQREEILSDARPESSYPALSPDMSRSAYESILQRTQELSSDKRADAPAAPEPGARLQFFTSNYQVQLQPYVSLNIGGVVYNATLQQVQGGFTGGGTYIGPEIFAQLQAAFPSRILVNVPWSGTAAWWPFRAIYFNLQPQGGQLQGTYNYQTGDFLFLGGSSAGGNVGNTSCGAIGIGSLSGNISEDLSRMTNGQYSLSFIAGCTPVLVSASITFYFTAFQVR